MYELWHRIMEIRGACNLYPKSRCLGLRRTYLSFGGFMYTLMQWGCIVVSVHMLKTDFFDNSGGKCTQDSNCWYRVHNIEFLYLVAARWFLFLMRLLCFHSLGRAALPAIYAVKAKKTVWYVAFLIVFWLLAAASFYVQPIELDQATIEECTRRPFMLSEQVCQVFSFLDKVFSVAFMGQYDVDDVEGMGEIVTGLLNQTSFNGTLANTPISKYHIAVSVWLTLTSFLINILALNVFISLVSTEYDRTCAISIASLMQYRSHFMFRDLLRQIDCCPGRSPLSQSEEEEQHWIYIKSKEFSDKLPTWLEDHAERQMLKLLRLSKGKKISQLRFQLQSLGLK
jgi:hypothetical protein